MKQKTGTATAIQGLYDRDGVITASSVLTEAKKKTSPLHNKFEWDDTKAGKLFRLVQARTLIRTVKIVFKGEETALVHIPSIKKEEGEYKPVLQVVKTEDEFERALNGLLTQMNALQRAASELQEAAETHGTEESVHIAVIMQSLNTAESAMKMITQH